MPRVDDPSLLTIVEARAAIQARRLSATELAEAVLARIDRLNPSLNAYLHVDAEAALAQARAADRAADDRPLRGIPICVKDVIDVAGMPTTAGASGWRRHPERDATAVVRLRAAGAVIIGKGHTNEFAYGIDGRNPHWGDCLNPRDPTRLCGGSSSGPAVATAAGMALAGVGTDTSGSLRVPAAFCGVVGVRPTIGLVPTDGVVALAASYDTVGPMARTAADAALVLGAMSGRPSADALDDGLRLGLVEQLLEAAEPYIAETVLEAARGLERLGARVTAVRLSCLATIPEFQPTIQRAEAAHAHQDWFEDQRERYSDPVRRRIEAGRGTLATEYLAAQARRRALIEEVARETVGLDVLLAPTATVVAPPRDAEELVIRGRRGSLRDALLRCVLPASQLGHPAVSVPLGALDGLPIGMQLIGRPRSEPLLLALAGRL